MNFKGEQILNSSPAEIWDTMLDPAYIIRLTPEVSAIQEIAPDHYRVSTQIKVGFVKKRFTGSIKVERISINEVFQLSLVQKSSIGNVEGTCTIEMVEENAQTRIHYHGDLTMDGLVGRVGMPLVKTMINPVIKGFLKEFDKRYTQV